MTSTVQNSDLGTVSWIPDGYVVVIRANDQHYVVPEFCVPALHHSFDDYCKKEEMEVFKAVGSVSTSYFIIYFTQWTAFQKPMKHRTSDVMNAGHVICWLYWDLADPFRLGQKIRC